LISWRFAVQTKIIQSARQSSTFAAIIQSLSTDLQAAYDLLPTTASVADSSESGAIVLPTRNVQFA